MSQKKHENAAAAGSDRQIREQEIREQEIREQADAAAAADAMDPAEDAAEDAAAEAAATDAEAAPVTDDPATAAADPVALLEAEVAAVRAELADQRDRFLRTVAEMDNLRKRSRREVQEAHRFARAEALRPLLDVLDNFDRALAHAESQDATAAEGQDQAFRQGVAMIAGSFRQALLDQGVRPIAAVGEPFDPARHEAVGQQPADQDTESGTVIAVVQQGYTLDDLVLRASRVIVAQ